MSVKSFLHSVTESFYSFVDMIQGKPKPEHPLIRYGTPIAFTLLALIALSAIYVGYRWYAVNREQNAQYACSKLMDEYAQLQKDEHPDYAAFVTKVVAAYNTYASSAVAPYLGLLAVDTYLAMGNSDEAVALMNRVANAKTYHATVNNLFQTKQALLMIDSADTALRDEGLKKLAMLADNTDNPHRDYALYHLGLYHWHNNDLQSARVAWQELAESQEVELRAPSPWADVIADKLSTIPA